MILEKERAFEMESSHLESFPKNRKRKADAISRLAASTTVALDPSSDLASTGRGSASGWTHCPLCLPYSKKMFALGRGIASHLHSVHTPWNPGKNELKKRRREKMRSDAMNRKNEGGERQVLGKDNAQKPDKWEPTEEEVEQWETQVVKLVKELEDTAATFHVEDDKIKCKILGPGVDRVGNKASSYRTSLPPFLKAAADGDLKHLKQMVEESKDVVGLLNTRDRHLSVAEHWAAGGGHLDCLEYLVQLRKTHALDNNKSGSDSQSTRIRRRDGKTSLHYAARNGHVHCIDYLLRENIYAVDELSGESTTPLHLACFGGQLEAAQFLYMNGANVAACNEWGCSAAHWAAMTKCTDEVTVRALCDWLQDRNVSFEQQQKQGHSALHKAAQRKNRILIEWMAGEKANGGAGLTQKKKNLAGSPDIGGHRPSDIWLSVGGEPTVAEWMRKDLGW